MDERNMNVRLDPEQFNALTKQLERIEQAQAKQAALLQQIADAVTNAPGTIRSQEIEFGK